MDTKEMEARIKELEKEVRTLRDIEEIKNVQKAYGYYLEHWMYEEVIDLFADSPDCLLQLMAGVFLGKKGIRHYFETNKDLGQSPEFLHQVMQLSGIVDVEADGKTAQGRWYGFGAIAMHRGNGVSQMFMGGIYEAVYIREGGKWRILELRWNPIITAPPGQGWVKPERLATGPFTGGTSKLKPDRATEIDSRYPSGYIFPFHFKHPVTGKETSEKKHNATLNLKKYK